MKSVKITLLLAGIAGAAFLGGCNKNKPMDDIARTVQVQQNGEGDENKDARKKAEEYQKMIEGVASTMSQYDEYTLEVELDEEGNYTVTPYAGRMAHPPQGILICQDTYVSLAILYCASYWQTAHPNCKEKWYFDNPHHTVSVYGICPG